MNGTLLKIFTIIPNVKVPLWLAIISDVGLSLIAIANSILILKKKHKKGDINETK